MAVSEFICKATHKLGFVFKGGRTFLLLLLLTVSTVTVFTVNV